MKIYKQFLKFNLDKVMILDYKIIHYKKTGYLRVYVKGQISFQDHWFCVGDIEDSAVRDEPYLKAFIKELLYNIRINPNIKQPKIVKEF